MRCASSARLFLQFPGGTGISGLISVGAAAQPPLALLKVGQIAQCHVWQQPDTQNPRSERGEKAPADEAEIQDKEGSLHPAGLLTAETDSLADR